ncbi:hypothetical protein D3C71_2093750 [compost metagenome]
MFPALVLERLLPRAALGGIFRLALQQRLVGNIMAPHIALTDAQVRVEFAEQLPRPTHRPSQVGHAPADPVGGRVGD